MVLILLKQSKKLLSSFLNIDLRKEKMRECFLFFFVGGLVLIFNTSLRGTDFRLCRTKQLSIVLWEGAPCHKVTPPVRLSKTTLLLAERVQNAKQLHCPLTRRIIQDNGVTWQSINQQFCVFRVILRQILIILFPFLWMTGWNPYKLYPKTSPLNTRKK